MTLGQRIQELRKQAGLSQEGLGEALGVSRQAVSKWESDGGIPELDTLIAMSRLFRITVGQLLGVETPEEREEAAEPAPGFTEEQVEDILRRYAEETRPPRPTQAQWLRKWGWLPAAAIVAVTVIAVLFARVNSLQSTVRMLRSDVSALESRASDGLSSVSAGIRETILTVLEEQNNPISSFTYEVVGFDLVEEELVLRLDAVLKTYTRGETEVQYVVNWTKDGESGQEVTFWKNNGPDWTDSVTIPMNEYTTVSVRIRDGEGLTQEYPMVLPIHSLTPENFMLSVDSLWKPFAVTIRGRSFVSTTARAEKAFIQIWSGYPDNIKPVKAVLSAWLNEEQVLQEELVLERSEEQGLFEATLQEKYF